MKVYDRNQQDSYQMNREDKTSVTQTSPRFTTISLLVQKHMTSTWQEPTLPHDREAMREIVALLKAHDGPLFWTLCGQG